MATNRPKLKVVETAGETCPDWIALVAWYDGDVEDKEVFWQVACHLPTCADCRDRVRFLRSVRMAFYELACRQAVAAANDSGSRLRPVPAPAPMSARTTSWSSTGKRVSGLPPVANSSN